MNEKNPKPGRFQAVDPNAARAWAPIKINAAARRLAFQLFGCLAVGACIALVHATGDMSTRLALILTGAVLAAGGFHTGAWWRSRSGKEGGRHG